eukprot:TRINITY_DN2734_c0_g3_i1.p1 TRINITY_DN2734_c0_g3~~TRINITY_DN2734_c0_g3_i1.p1  ORF type:complete len:521 (-),score=63.23 TRINITY_DN2734_c0_g3_i1:427-1959(-)
MCDINMPNAELPTILGATKLAPEKVEDAAGDDNSDAVFISSESPVEDARTPVMFVLLISMCSALNSANIGFDIGVSSGVAILIREDMDLNDVQVGAFIGLIHFIAAFGSLNSHAVSDRLGRRLTFTVTQVVLLAGLAVSLFSRSFALLMVGRVLVGLGIGLGLAIDALYIAELAPAQHRGKLTAWPEIAVNLGILIGFFANWLLADLGADFAWRYMIACGAFLPCLLIILSLTIMPESPRWLIAKGRVGEATELLKRTHPAGEDVATLVDGILKDIDDDAQAERLGWRTLLCPSANVRRSVLVALGVAFAQQINASESVVAYSPEIFKRAGVASTTSSLFAITMLVGFVKCLFVVIAASFVDNCGRRPLLVLSTAGATISLAMLSLGTYLGVSWLSVAAVCCFMAVFSLGLGPMPWLLAAELFPSRLRAKGTSLATFLNRCTSGTIALTFLPVSRALGGQANYFAFFALLTAISALACYKFVPETSQRTLEELQQTIGENSSEKKSAVQV